VHHTQNDWPLQRSNLRGLAHENGIDTQHHQHLKNRLTSLTLQATEIVQENTINIPRLLIFDFIEKTRIRLLDSSDLTSTTSPFLGFSFL